MDRVKKMANELLERYPDKFTSDFNENKETIKNFAIVRSKELRNKIAGYITKTINRNLAQQNASLSYSEENPEPREEIAEYSRNKFAEDILKDLFKEYANNNAEQYHKKSTERKRSAEQSMKAAYRKQHSSNKKLCYVL